MILGVHGGGELPMANDLYRIDLQRTSAAQLYAAVEDFTAVKLPFNQRPPEGFLLDFKQDWSESALHTVAAFANTFGGLLLLGVSDKDSRPEDIIGISWPGELKNRIASIVSANIVPCPSFEIGECALPADPAMKVCVVRVKESPEMCLITKKGEKPVRVRVEDQSPSADAAQLRALLHRKQSKEGFRSRIEGLRNRWSSSLLVTKLHTPEPSRRVMTGTRLWAVLFPFEHPEIEIDVNIEQSFYSTIQRCFPCYGSDKESVDPGPRSRDSYQIHRLILGVDFERVWQFDSTGAFGLASQTAWGDGANGLCWSLCDLVIDLALLMRASRAFWESFGYFGGAQLVVRLGVEGLSLHCTAQGFPAILYAPTGPIARDALAIAPKSVSTNPMEFEFDVTFQTDVVYMVSRIANQLMRALGHTADLPKLEQSIGSILASMPR
jgi:hypothetical protein